MSKSSFSRPLVMALCTLAMLIAAAVLLTPSTAATEPPASEAVDSADAVTLAEGCELMQLMSYTRCDHSVTRRVTAPVEIYGKTLAEVEAMYPEWRITEFAATLIRMEQQLQLFCPDHMVLMPDSAGTLCVFENKYGDALALVSELGVALRDLPAAAQEEVAPGLGFDTPEELEQWLESVES